VSSFKLVSPAAACAKGSAFGIREFFVKSSTKNFCFAPSKLFSQTTRLCAVGEQRAGSACRVLRAEIKASSKFKRETVSSFKLAP